MPHKITWLNSGQTIMASEGQTVLDAAIEHDIPLNHACGGFCACTTCHIVVKSGAEHLSAMEEDEADRLESNGKRTPDSRLACQSKVRGDIVLEIPT